MFGWLKSKLDNNQREEFERFLLVAKGADTDAINLMAGSVMFWAAFYGNKGRDLYSMENWINLKENALFPLELGQSIKGLQKQGTTLVVPGLMVWLFSARALLHPDQRFFGRELWKELARSSFESEGIAIDFARNMGLKIDGINAMKVPYGLESLSR